MHNSRQNKKAAEQKKRHFEQVKARGSAKGTSPKGATSPKGTTPPKVKEGEASKEQRGSELTKTTSSKGSKSNAKENKLGSNLDRYEEPEVSELHYQENEEQLQQRLDQLLNLPIHHVIPPTISPLDNVPDSDSFLTMDCAALAESLSTIPLHEVLKISPDLVLLCEMEAAQPITAESALTVAMEVDLSACKRKREYAFEFKAPSVSTSASDENSYLQAGRGKFSASVQKGKSEEGLKKSLLRPIMVSKSQGSARTTIRVNLELEQDRSHENEALDKLLADGNTLGGPSQKGPSGGPTQDRVSGGLTRDKGAEDKSVPSKEPPAEDKGVESVSSKEKGVESVTSKEGKGVESVSSKVDKGVESVSSKEEKEVESLTSKEDKGVESVSSKEDKGVESVTSKEDKGVESETSKEGKWVESVTSKEGKWVESVTSKEDKVVESETPKEQSQERLDVVELDGMLDELLS